MSTIYWGLHVSVSNGGKVAPVILLARAGAARERLREAVVAAGGEVVVEDDPSTLAPEALQVEAARVVLVALEPAIEDALERLQPVLESPQLTIIFDEAELAARRDGWEAQRWIRHLAAKLHGHGNVLPPGHEADQALVQETAPSTLPLELSADSAAPVLQQQPLNDGPLSTDEWRYVAEPEPVPAAAPELQPLSFEWPTAPRSEVAAQSIEPPPLPPVARDYSSWSLVEDDALLPVAVRNEVSAPEISSFLTRELSLLEIDEGPSATTGAVLLLAGIGGPDARRRFLGALPESFERPVLVQMRLDGGRDGNLVKQMARVTQLPVLLAEPGKPLQASSIYVLADTVGIAIEDGALRFIADPALPVIETLPAADSAVVMLSGADQDAVEVALALAAQGGWVAGQVSEGCYDPAAAIRLAAHGMSTGDPVYLANALSERYGS